MHNEDDGPAANSPTRISIPSIAPANATATATATIDDSVGVVTVDDHSKSVNVVVATNDDEQPKPLSSLSSSSVAARIGSISKRTVSDSAILSASAPWTIVDRRDCTAANAATDETHADGKERDRTVSITSNVLGSSGSINQLQQQQQQARRSTPSPMSPGGPKSLLRSSNYDRTTGGGGSDGSTSSLSGSYSSARRVSFPENDAELVTGYLEPANPWATGECTD